MPSPCSTIFISKHQREHDGQTQTTPEASRTHSLVVQLQCQSVVSPLPNKDIPDLLQAEEDPGPPAGKTLALTD